MARRTHTRVAGLAALVLVGGLLLFARWERGSSAPETGPPPPATSAAPLTGALRPLPLPSPDTGQPPDARDAGKVPAIRDPGYWRDAGIEEIKQAIYARQIDSIDDLDQLDEFVQESPAAPEDFWETGWSGVDDWKRYEDGFQLERDAEGRLLFVPDDETRLAYSFFENINVYEYDDQMEAFVHQVDYYGKPIINVVKFLRQDVLVRMTVSGKKVDLNIYEQDPQRRD